MYQSTDTRDHPSSYYFATANKIANRPSLFGQVDADICVIGGGYTGLTAALHLAERGYSVVLLEANKVGWGASGRNGGQLHSGQRRDQHHLEKAYGTDAARHLWQLAMEARELTKDLVRRHDIDCDLSDGLVHGIHKQRWIDDERAYVDHLQKTYAYDEITPLDRDEVASALGTGVYHSGWRDGGAGHLHPLNYALGLANAAEKAGATLYENTLAQRIDDGDPSTVVTEDGAVRARVVVLAGNGYLSGFDKEADARVMPINNFILATEPLGDDGAAALIPGNEAASDTRFVVNYWRLSADNRMLFGGGENYSTRFPDDMKAFVRKRMLRIYPQLADTRIDYAWGGTLAVTQTRLPFIRRLSPVLYCAAGFSGQGVGTAGFAGKVMAEAIAGDQERLDVFAGLKTPRFPGGALLRWPTLVLAMTWFSLRDRL